MSAISQPPFCLLLRCRRRERLKHSSTLSHSEGVKCCIETINLKHDRISKREETIHKYWDCVLETLLTQNCRNGSKHWYYYFHHHNNKKGNRIMRKRRRKKEAKRKINIFSFPNRECWGRRQGGIAMLWRYKMAWNKNTHKYTMIIIVYASSFPRFISGAIVLKFTDRILFVSVSQHFTWKHNPNYVSFRKFLSTCWSGFKCPIGGCKN